MSEKDPSITLVKNEASEENHINLHDESMQIVKVEPTYEKEITRCLMEQDLLFNTDITNLPVRKKEIMKNDQCMNNLQKSRYTISCATSNTLTYNNDRTHAQDFFTHKRITLPNNEQKSVKYNFKDYYQCELCNFKTTKQTSVVSHLREQHDSIIFECQRCDYVTRWRHCLIRHVAIYHADLQFKCQLCNFVSKWKSNLIEHLKTHGPSNRKLLHSLGCNQSRLAENMKQCYSSTGFNCTHCDYVTKFKKRLIFHMKSCHDSVE